MTAGSHPALQHLGRCYNGYFTFHQTGGDMRKTLLAALAVLIAVPAFAAEQPKTEDQKTLYAVGLVMARQLSILSLSPEELELVKQGMTDGVTGKAPLVDVEAYKMKINQFAVDRRNAEG